MARNMETTKDSTQLTMEKLKRETNITDQQLDTRIEQLDLPFLANYFDNINHGYLEAMNLTLGQQTDVRDKTHEYGTSAGMILALTLWLNSQLRGTFRALIVILLHLSKLLVAEQVFKYLSRKDSPPLSGSSQERNPRLSSYRDYLQRLYKKLKLSSTTQWPPVSTKKVFKLAMIQKEKIQRGRMDDEFVRLTITGNIVDILYQKELVELKNIFSNTEDDEQKFVLIEGAPGSGKSTLALHICQEWAKGKLFQEFDITILVRLRDPLNRYANLEIEMLLPSRNSAMASEVGAEILETDGKGVLWVLDGWDELPAGLPRDSIINKLIQPGRLQESPLHESTVIITSRPSSSAELHPIVSSKVEVLGFTPQQLEQYFTDCLNGDSKAIKTLLDRIQENPVIENICYLPLNASIVVNCFLSDNHSLPTTNHHILTSVVQGSLKRYLQDRLGKTTSMGNITSPDSLPSEVRTPFIQMCNLAYYGIDQNEVIFTNKDFTIFCITEDISNIGLLQSISSILGNDQLVYYCFLHLSIQELLAAIHISLMSSRDQIAVFDMLFGQPRFSAVFQHYAGITKLKNVLDLVENIVKSECEKKYGEPKPFLLSLMHCLHEVEDLTLCAFVADLLNHELHLMNTTMNPIDCFSVGYFASLTTKPFSLNLSYCSIGDKGCKFLACGLSKCPHSHCKIDLYISNNYIHDEGVRYIVNLPTNIALLHLSYNKIGDSGLSTLCNALSINTSLTHLTLSDCSLTLNDHGAIPQLLRTNTTLQYLDISFNKIGNNELNNLCDALSTNTSLKILGLGYCSLAISDDNGSALYQLLSKNYSLKKVDLSFNTVTSCHHIAAGLAVNKTLRILNLAECELTDRSIKELLAGLINNIEELNISNNHLITTDGVKTLVRHLTSHCPKLNILSLP